MVSGELLPKIYGRRASHYTRLVRIVACELAFDYEFVIVRKLMSLAPEEFGDHPGLKIPTMSDEAGAWFGAVNICREIAARKGAPGRFARPYSKENPGLFSNFNEIVFQAMATQVTAVLVREVARLDDGNRFALKTTESLRGMMGWLNQNVSVFSRRTDLEALSLAELALFCLVEHVQFRNSLEIAEFPELVQFVEKVGVLESAVTTRYQIDE